MVVLEIDDSTSADQPPFTLDVSMWSFNHDVNLATRTGAEVFRKMHEAVDSSRFRGYPECVAHGPVTLFDSFVDSSEVTWLTVAELGRERPWLPRNFSDNLVVRTLHAFFGAIEAVAAQFGPDRVRLVFAFV